MLVDLGLMTDAIDAEPETWDEMPDEVFEVLRNNKSLMDNLFVSTVKQTKEGIKKRLLDSISNEKFHVGTDIDIRYKVITDAESKSDTLMIGLFDKL